MKPTERLLNGEYRLLEVDNCVVLPTNVIVRILVSSFDVIHSWCIPRIGVKLDAVPGRLNGAGMCVDLSGAIYGQCRELCGSDHAFMPIVVEFVELEDYIAWLG
jgi:heme/copper-type cytochrome/quinol oxidase subunit 2